jgi:hypothetical protein
MVPEYVSYYNIKKLYTFLNQLLINEDIIPIKFYSNTCVPLVVLIWFLLNCFKAYFYWIKSSFLMYYLTTVAGHKEILRNFVYGKFYAFIFLLCLYTSILMNEDKEALNLFLGHIEYFKYEKVQESMNNSMPLYFTGPFLKKLGYDISDTTQKEILQKIANTIPKIILAMRKDENHENIVEELYKVLSGEKDFFCPTLNIEKEIDIEKEMKILKKFKKNSGKGVKTSKQKMKLREVLETKENGDIVCKEECRERVKTISGCYCESDCGSTFYLGGKTWCYVDPKKCNKKVFKDKDNRSYDYCDKKVVKPKCFTGYKYKTCDVDTQKVIE